MGKVSPSFWVRREALPRTRSPRWVEARSPMGLWAIDPTLDVDTTEARDDVVYGSPAGLDLNKSWTWDVQRARRLLRHFTAADLKRELAVGQRIVEASQRTHRFWEYETRMRPVFYTIPKQPGEFPMPELAAIPFYRTEDARPAFMAIHGSHFAVSLLSGVTDKKAAREHHIATARKRRGFPLTERRGRPKGRPAPLVQQIWRMVHEEGLPKRRVAKLLDMPRTTVHDYAKEGERQRKPEGE